jgi:hypothetical protein
MWRDEDAVEEENGKKKKKKQARSKSKSHKFSNINARAFISVIQDSKDIPIELSE